MAKKFILLSFLFLAFTFVNAQGVFNFPVEKHDFGLVQEGTQAAFSFEFTNTGTAPIVLSDVRASCGCTTPEWTREPIAPGGKGIIKASYNSEGRPGNFVKTITVTSNASEPSKVLYIKGVVEPKKEKATPTAEQLKSSPKATFDKTSYTFGKSERGQKLTTKFNLKNSGRGALTVVGIQSACNCITHKLDKESIPSGKSGVLELTYGPQYDGKNIDIAILETNDIHNPKVTLTLNSEVVESLASKSPVSQEKPNVPFSK